MWLDLRHVCVCVTASCKRLRKLGCDIAPPAPWEITGFHLQDGPHIVLDPNMGPTYATLAPKFPKPANVRVAPGSTLLLSGPQLIVESLNLAGTLLINAAPGAIVSTFELSHRAMWTVGH